MPKQAVEPTDATTAGTSPFDFEREAARVGPPDARLQFARAGVCTHFANAGGRGTSDTVRYGDDVLLTVLNCVLPDTARWRYKVDEPLIVLRASLSCNVAFRFPQVPPLVFNRPEVVLACVPAGQSMDAEIAGGVRQQGIVAVFRGSSFAARYGLSASHLPHAIRDALKRSGSVGRIASFPLDHRIAALVADTIDTRLDGELRVVQYGGRLAELVAYTLDAIANTPSLRMTTLGRRRDVELAAIALGRLERDYRRPPLFADLAHDIGTNQNKLKAVFKHAYGVTMADYCLERRMREAHQLLLEATLTIGQIAERVGYEHQSSFTAAFRSHVGMAPREYRRHRAPFTVPLGTAGPNA